MEENKNLDETNENIVETMKVDEIIRTEEEISKIKIEITESKEDANVDFKKGNFLSAINKYTICTLFLFYRHQPGRRN